MCGKMGTHSFFMKTKSSYLWPAEGYRIGGGGSRGAELGSPLFPITATPTVLLLLLLLLLLNSCGCVGVWGVRGEGGRGNGEGITLCLLQVQ